MYNDQFILFFFAMLRRQAHGQCRGTSDHTVSLKGTLLMMDDFLKLKCVNECADSITS